MYINTHTLLVVSVAYLLSTTSPFSTSNSRSARTAPISSAGANFVAAATTVTKSFDFTTDAIDYQRGKDWDLASDGLSRFTLKRGASLEVSFFGTGIRIYGAKNSQGAEWKLDIDGGEDNGGQTHQLSSFLDGPKTRNQLLFDSGETLGSANSQHSLSMEHRGTDGRQAVDFEGLELVQAVEDDSASSATSSGTAETASAASDSVEQASEATTSTTGTTATTATVSDSVEETSSTSSLDTSSEVLSSAQPQPEPSRAPVESSSQADTSTPSPTFSTPSSETARNISGFIISTTSRATTTTSSPTSTSDTSSTPASSPDPRDDGVATDSSQDPSASSLGAQQGDGESADGQDQTSGRSSLAVVVPLALAVPLTLLVAGVSIYRLVARKKRQGRVLKWSHRRGLRYSLDFECRGDREITGPVRVMSEVPSMYRLEQDAQRYSQPGVGIAL